MYSVILDGGRTFTNLGRDGSYYVSEQEVTAEMFKGWNGKYRVVSEGAADEYGLSGEYAGSELKDVFKGSSRWYFALGEVDRTAVEAMRDRADIDYIAMMTGIEL